VGRLILSLVVISACTESLAQTRPNTARMSCAQAQGLVGAQGAVVLYSGPYTYDRFVRDSTFCPRPDRTEPAWISTADTAQCLVGYRCVWRPLRMRD
jgi:hypothetical protein